MTEWTPGGRSARQALLARLERGEAIGATAESAAVMRAALRDVAALAARWRAGINDVGPAAAAEVCDAICGELAGQHPGQPAVPGYEPGEEGDYNPIARDHRDPPPQRGHWQILPPPEEDQPWRSGGEVPGG